MSGNKEYKIGDVVYWDNLPCTVTKLSEGEYGQRVTFTRGGTTITTTPGLDPRFSDTHVATVDDDDGDIECPLCGGCLIERDHARSSCPGPYKK